MFFIAQAGLSFDAFGFCAGVLLIGAPVLLGAAAVVVGLVRRMRPAAVPARGCAVLGAIASVVGLLCLAYDLFAFDKPAPLWILSLAAPALIGGPLALWWSGLRRPFYAFATLSLLLIGGAVAWFSVAEWRNDRLLRAADRGNTGVVMRAIAEGADIETADGNGQTLLAHAVRSGRHDTVRVLLLAGANPNAVSTSMITDAVLKRDAIMVKELLEGGADVRTVFYGSEFLVDAARKQSTPEIAAMIEQAMKNGPRPKRRRRS